MEPEALVLLGATAAKALLGSSFRLTRHRGEFLDSELAPLVTATIHPSAILRAPDDAAPGSGALRSRPTSAWSREALDDVLPLLRDGVINHGQQGGEHVRETPPRQAVPARPPEARVLEWIARRLPAGSCPIT